MPRPPMPVTCLLLLGLASLVPLAANAQGPGTAQFAANAGIAAGVPAYAATGAVVSGTLPPRPLTRPRIELTLPDGRRVVAHRRHVARDKGRVTWRGGFAKSPESSLTLTEARGSVAGTLIYDGSTYELTPVGTGGGLVLYAIDPTRLPPTGPLLEAPGSRRRAAHATVAASSTDTVPAQPASDPEAGVVHDLLVVTTPFARAALSREVLEARILNAIEDANAAYQAGAIGITLRLVGIHDAELTERSGMEQTLAALREDAGIAARRDATAADLVMLIAQHVDYCGLAYFMDRYEAGFAPYAYGVTSLACLANRTLAHELGHIQGLAHDRETSTGGSSSPYAFGYRDCQGGVRDIMAYACTAGYAAPVNRFSSPRTWIDGRPLGIDYEIEPARAADAARALGDSAGVVAAFRTAAATPGVTLPRAPMHVTARPTGPAEVQVDWEQVSGEEAGFFVERTIDGVHWLRIATLEAGATAFADDSTVPGVVYSYRLRAWNGAGVSAASVVATVLIDVVPESLAFAELQDVPFDRWAISAPVTVTGINVAVALTVSGGEHSVGCTGAFSALPAAVAEGQQVCLRHRSAAAPSTRTTTTLVLGTDTTVTFSSTTTAVAPAIAVPRAGQGGGGATRLVTLLPLLVLGLLRRRAGRAHLSVPDGVPAAR